jgi:predicted amidophosphoribosyltransferase
LRPIFGQHRLRRIAVSVLHPVLDFVLPSDCLACNHALDARHRMGICSTCWSAFQRLPRPSCLGCGLPRLGTSDLLGPARDRCATCLASEPALDGVRAVVVYDRLARTVVLESKLGRRPELLGPVAKLMSADLRASRFARDGAGLVAVPSHPWSDMRRGFSPATELARRISRELGIPHLRAALARRWLPLGTAKRLARRGRISFAARAFRARRHDLPDRVVLVDDVMTTGATLEACAAALKTAGVGEVRGFVWARAFPPTWPKQGNGLQQ